MQQEVYSTGPSESASKDVHWEQKAYTSWEDLQTQKLAY